MHSLLPLLPIILAADSFVKFVKRVNLYSLRDLSSVILRLRSTEPARRQARPIDPWRTIPCRASGTAPRAVHLQTLERIQGILQTPAPQPLRGHPPQPGMARALPKKQMRRLRGREPSPRHLDRQATGYPSPDQPPRLPWPGQYENVWPRVS